MFKTGMGACHDVDLTTERKNPCNPDCSLYIFIFRQSVFKMLLNMTTVSSYMRHLRKPKKLTYDVI